MERKVFNYLLLIITPIILLLVGICAISPSDDFGFSYVKNDCSNQSLWLYKRMYVDTERIDVAFFGSSHTLRAINDSILNASDKKLHTANFGYCRFGRDLQYILFKKLLERMKISTAFFEVTETEPSYSHPDYAFLAESSDIFLPAFIQNQEFIKNRYDAFLFHLAYLRQQVFGVYHSVKPCLRTYGYVSNNGKADSTYLQNQKEEKLKDLRSYDASNVARKAELSFSFYYLNKIKELAAKNNCKVYFIYLPAYGNDVKNSLDSAFYKPYFETLLTPDSILSNYRNWQDEAHFNNEGAAHLTKWLIQQIKEK